MKKETSALWYKDGHEIKSDQNLGFTEGVLKLEIAQVGMYSYLYAYFLMVRLNLYFLAVIIIAFIFIFPKTWVLYILWAFSSFGHQEGLRQQKAQKVVDIFTNWDLKKGKALLQTFNSSIRP